MLFKFYTHTKISTRIFYNHSYTKYPTCTCMFNQISMGKLIPIAFPVRSKATHGEIIFYCVDKYPDLQTYSVRWGVSPVQKQTQVSPSFTGNTGVLLLHNIIAHVKHTKDISCTRTYTCVCFNYIFVENGVHTKKKTTKL